MIEWLKVKFLQLCNIVSGKDRNWDGTVDIKDKMMDAEDKAKG
jgi:hypothetical protein|tara:strand:- start:5651 stop:5779 length:129 start_codon:yes stop_codon:yes gene_type:complete